MKKLLTISPLLWLLLAANVLIAQEKTTLNFELPEDFKPLVTYTLLKVEDLSKFRGIPADTVEASVFLQNLQRNQSGYTNYLKGYYSKEYFDKIVAATKTDTVNIYKKKDLVNALLVLSAILPNNRKIVIPDLNSNGDFSDDKAFEYTVTDYNQKFSTDSLETLEFDYDYYHQGKLYKQNLKFKLAPTNQSYSFKDPRIKRLNVYLTLDGRKGTEATVAGKPYLFTMQSTLNADYTKAYLSVKDMTNSVPLRFNPNLNVGDVFSLEGKRVKIDQVSFFGETGVLNVTEPGAVNLGVRQEDTLPDSSLNALRHRLDKSADYTLVDFWGSWCGPCIEALPDLKKVYEKYRNDPKFQLVSVAYENSKDLTKLNALVEKHGIDWQNIIEYQAKQGDAPNYQKMVRHFDVSTFPTTILLDKDGKIVYRDSGSDSFERLNAALAKELGY